MRLIDADWLVERLAKEPMENRSYSRANEIVAEAPTAYDVDKVIKGIRNIPHGEVLNVELEEEILQIVTPLF